MSSQIQNKSYALKLSSAFYVKRQKIAVTDKKDEKIVGSKVSISCQGHSMSNLPMVETVPPPPPQSLMKFYTFGLYGQKRRSAKY